MAGLSRDFELLEEFLDRGDVVEHEDGDLLPDAPQDPEPCTADCCFERQKPTAMNPVFYVCKRHRRVHLCGEKCCHKIISHEDASCEWTGEVMKEKLIAEVVNRGQIRARSQGCFSGADPRRSGRHQATHDRVKEAMEEVAVVCKDAVEKVEKEKGAFVLALRKYFHRVNSKSKALSGVSVNKKRIVQFGLACAYLHRTGISVKKKVLFKKNEDFKKLLPRTHALLKKNLKVGSITRSEVLLKELIKQDQFGAGGVEMWQFPEF